MSENHPIKDYALVFAANNAFSPGFLVTLASALASSDLKNFNIHFLHDEDENVDQIVAEAQRICRSFDFPEQNFITTPIDLHPFKVCDAYAGNYLAYARIQAIKLLDESRIIYLDSDMLVIGDLSELIQSIPETVALAAAHDTVLLTHDNDGYLLDGKTGSPNSKYFNSGLLVLNTSECNKIDLLGKFKSLTSRLVNANYADQSYLNVIFENQWFEIPPQWNRMTTPTAPDAIFSEPDSAKILHYITARKPWCYAEPSAPNVLWHSLALSIGIELDPTVHRKLTRKVRSRRRRRKLGIMQLKHLYYKLKGKKGKKTKILQRTNDLVNHTAAINDWLTKHNFDMPPKSLRIK